MKPSISRPFPSRFPDLFYFFFPRRPEPAGAEAADVCGGGREGGDTRTRGDQTKLESSPARRGNIIIIIIIYAALLKPGYSTLGCTPVHHTLT